MAKAAKENLNENGTEKTVICRSSAFSCMLKEIGNFGYSGSKTGVTHYHRPWNGSGPSDTPVNKWNPTPKSEIVEVIKKNSGDAYYLTTGSDQEYLHPILEELGFVSHKYASNWDPKGPGTLLWFAAKKDLKLS